MCRLLGLVAAPDSADSALPVWQQLVGAPNSLRNQAENGAVPKDSAAGHDDSWGIGWFDQAGRVSLVRQVGSAAESAYFILTSEAAARGGPGSGPARVAVGHLRKASCGAVTSENAHPVRADYDRAATGAESLLVAHNGTIHEPLLTLLRGELADSGREEARADSDTVVLTGYLALCLAKAPGGQSVHESLGLALRHLLSSAAEELAPGVARAYTAINLLIAHDTGLYALRQFSSEGSYYTLNARPLTEEERPGGGWIVASERTDSSQAWQELMPSALYFYPIHESTQTPGGRQPLSISVA